MTFASHQLSTEIQIIERYHFVCYHNLIINNLLGISSHSRLQAIGWLFPVWDDTISFEQNLVASERFSDRGIMA